MVGKLSERFQQVCKKELQDVSRTFKNSFEDKFCTCAVLQDTYMSGSEGTRLKLAATGISQPNQLHT